MLCIEKERSRRDFSKMAGGGLLLLALLQLSGKSLPSQILDIVPEDKNPTEKPKGLGFTFSTKQCQNLGMNEQQTHDTLEKLCSLNFDIIRICSYWDEIDKESYFDFTKLDWQLEMAQKYGKEVILTVGIKSPRHPEFYFPDWILRKYPEVESKPNPVESFPLVGEFALEYIQGTVIHTRDYSAISHYQVGNESLNQINAKSLSLSFFKRELALVRSLKKMNQKILLTNALTDPSEDIKVDEIINLRPDAFGTNVYYGVPNEYGGIPIPIQTYRNIFSDNVEMLARWHDRLQALKIAAFATELQGEPWELWKSGKEILDQREFRSANPKDSIDLAIKLKRLGYLPLFWGAEYWVAHHLKYGGEYWLKPMADFANGFTLSPSLVPAGNNFHPDPQM
ncbi:MAG: beta-galactosidase [Candidatus Daviesbacteria bacterium]|nr:beta-galactosidase [Candidatus Daviesbacteria bacterium]